MRKGKTGIWISAGVFFLLALALLQVPGIRFSAALSAGIGCLLLLWQGLYFLTERWGKLLRRLFAAGLTALAVVLGCFEAVILAHGEEDLSALPVDAVIVLGAGVNGETPSLALRTRIETARDFLEEHPEVPVVLSGGQGSGEDITEAEAMRRELTEFSDRLLLEERSTSTAENFAFSKTLLEEAGIDTEEAVIAVVSNDFHLFRAKLIAEREDLHTIGVAAELPWWWLTANYYLREPFALVKTLIFD